MSAKDYRPWGLHRPAHRCEACGKAIAPGEDGLCVECEKRFETEPLPESMSWQRQSRDTW